MEPNIPLPQKLSWQAYEYVEKNKSVDWFWAVGIIAVALAITAFFMHNVLFGILIIIGSFMLAVFAVRKPLLLNFELNRRGIVAGKETYPYNNIKSFCMHRGLHGPYINVHTNKMLMPVIGIPLDGMDEDTVHAFLTQFVKEEHIPESVSQRMLDFLGF
ncbi:MAG: hypothetical protein WCW14_03205 [Candidatus Paceibacterota bacterium]|jgi:hypothetical protein